MKILVVGFFWKRNLGDDLFQEAFVKLFPSYRFSFSDHITKAKLENADAVFFGGGSLLDGTPYIEDGALELLLIKPIFYVGVGAETGISDLHKQLLGVAQLVAIRTPSRLDKIKHLNNNTIVIPDLVYALCVDTQLPEKEIRSKHRLLFIPNIYVIPQHDSPVWKHLLFSLFKNEISQTFDTLLDADWDIRMLGMSKSVDINDDNAAVEIINSMSHKSKDYVIDGTYSDFSDLRDLFSSFDFVISQRLHGVILAESCGVPYISIAHHDKLLGDATFKSGVFTSLGCASKDFMLKSINEREKQENIVINSDMFIELQMQITSILGRSCPLVMPE